MSVRKSVQFEKLTAKIIRELEPTADVKWNDHILGADSGIKRQIDVSIRRADPDFLGIIDAKDHARPATIERLDALSGVMMDVRANYGALVCSGGFAKTIHDYAKKRQISLFNLHDAESVNWSLELKIPILWQELTPLVEISGVPWLDEGDSIALDDTRGLQVTLDDGATVIDPLSTFERWWNGPSANRTPGMVHHLTSDRPVQAIVLDARGEQQLRPVANYRIAYVVQPKLWLGKFQPQECRGLVNVLDSDSFTASHLPQSVIPMQRDDTWELVEEPEKIAVLPRGAFVVCTQPILVNDGSVENFSIQYLGPDLDPSQPPETDLDLQPPG